MGSLRRVGAGHADAVDGGDILEVRLHRLLDGRVGDALRRLEHNARDPATALAAEVLVEEVDAVLALDVRERELRRVGGAFGTDGDAQRDERAEPHEDDEQAAVMAPTTETAEHWVP